MATNGEFGGCVFESIFLSEEEQLAYQEPYDEDDEDYDEDDEDDDENLDEVLREIAASAPTATEDVATEEDYDADYSQFLEMAERARSAAFSSAAPVVTPKPAAPSKFELKKQAEQYASFVAHDDEVPVVGPRFSAGRYGARDAVLASVGGKITVWPLPRGTSTDILNGAAVIYRKSMDSIEIRGQRPLLVLNECLRK